MRMPDADLMDALQAALGRGGVLTGADAEPFATDWRGLYRGRTAALLRPAKVDDVVAAVRLCAQAGVAIVPQGGNTSMVGGATPHEDGSQIVLTLSRMNRVRDVDVSDMTMTVEAGVTLLAAQQAADDAGCSLPLSISSEGSAQIGGVLATNAGGNMTLRHGNARDLVLGLEVVLADGRIWNGLRRLRKDNTGYCLRQLFVGSEGTLGIITAAVLRLVPRPVEIEVALCAAPSLSAVAALFAAMTRQEPGAVQAFEYMSAAGVGLVEKHLGRELPVRERAPHYVLIELASPRAGANLRGALEAELERALSAGQVVDAVIAGSQAQRASIWALREEHAEGQKREGASVKNDVSVPVSHVPELIERASDAIARLVPGVRPVPFGHWGDGNIHMNFEQPEGDDGGWFLSQGHAIMDAVNEIVQELGGSFSAEHGVGRLKTYLMSEWRGGVELDLMRRIKAAVDPAGLFNPGKLLPP